MAGREAVTARTGMGIDTKDFRNLARALQRAAPLLRREMTKELRAVGMIVAEDAKARASEYSSTIPPTIKVRVSRTTLAVEAGGGEVAIAGLFELGNKGGGKSQAASSRGSFRHPVFGNTKTWVNQPMHPFLAPAREHNLGKVEEGALAALDKAASAIAYGGGRA